MKILNNCGSARIKKKMKDCKAARKTKKSNRKSDIFYIYKYKRKREIEKRKKAKKKQKNNVKVKR